MENLFMCRVFPKKIFLTNHYSETAKRSSHTCMRDHNAIIVSNIS